eukprot:2548113-Pleurochrysis_carterae.AAC.1
MCIRDSVNSDAFMRADPATLADPLPPIVSERPFCGGGSEMQAAESTRGSAPAVPVGKPAAGVGGADAEKDRLDATAKPVGGGANGDEGSKAAADVAVRLRAEKAATEKQKKGAEGGDDVEAQKNVQASSGAEWQPK